MSSVAVVTGTIGRQTLHQTIQSVRAQTVCASHYVFVHGAEYWDKSRAILDKYDFVNAVYLPNNLASLGMNVYALAPYVVKEEFICFLDDDNWYETNHVESTVAHISSNDLSWVYSNRNIVDNEGLFICRDNCEQTGYFPNISNVNLVDNSSYVMRIDTARKYANSWLGSIVSDRKVLKTLLENKEPCGCTGLYTVNYRLSKDGSWPDGASFFLRSNERFNERYSMDFPWAKPSVLKFN